jgi:hypothetical protein
MQDTSFSYLCNMVWQLMNSNITSENVLIIAKYRQGQNDMFGFSYRGAGMKMIH